MPEREDRSVPLTPWSRPPPRDVVPNENDPTGSVGPNVDEGFGDTHALYSASNPPLAAQAWQGWPIGWDVPAPPGDTDWLGGAGWGWSPGMSGRVSTLWACVDTNARALVSMPPTRYREVGRSRVPMDSPEWFTNPEPNLYAHWGDFVGAVVLSLMMRGEAFVAATSSYAPDAAQAAAGRPGWPRTFYVAHPDAFRIEQPPGGGPWRYSWADSGEQIADQPVSPTLCHIRYRVVPGRAHGIGPLEACYPHLRAAAALTAYAADLAERGGVPWAILKSKVNLGATGASRLQQQWVSSARARGGAPAVLTGDFDLQTLTLDPKSMALQEMQELSERRIAAAFGVPDGLVGLSSSNGSMDYTSTLMEFDHHWRSMLKPLADNIGRALSNWALPRGQIVVLDPRDYVEPNLGERTLAYSQQHAAGALTVDEWRQLEGRGPLPTAEQPPPVAAPVPGGPL